VHTCHAAAEVDVCRRADFAAECLSLDIRELHQAVDDRDLAAGVLGAQVKCWHNDLGVFRRQLDAPVQRPVL
jgi:hypothetical protein